MRDVQRRRFTDIDPSKLQHPNDRMATDRLKKVPFFNKLSAMYIKFGVEPISLAFNDANNVKVGPKQIPKLYRMLHESCAILDMDKPDLYVSQRPEVNALTVGHTKPYIIVNSGLLEMMNEEEVMAVIAHELGHIKCEHMLYQMIIREMDVLIVAITSLSKGQERPLLEKTTQKAIMTALLAWERQANLTADRIALLVMQDSKPCISMLAKLAGGTVNPAYQLDPVEFLNQARQYKKEGSKEEGTVQKRVYQFLASAYRGTHPFAVERAHYLDNWIRGHEKGSECEYELILKGHYPHIPHKILEQPIPFPQTSQEGNIYCDKCGELTRAGGKFCSHCRNAL